MARPNPRALGLRLGAAIPLLLSFGVVGCTGPSREDATDGVIRMCSSCHGPEGRSVSPIVPRLAGQQEDYLVIQLRAFRDRTRADSHPHAYMWGIAERLTDAEVERLAAYYSTRAPAPGERADPTDMAAGKKIYDEGIQDHDIPKCAACHGDHAQGIDDVPRLAGQHRSYIAEQLAAFGSNVRPDESMHGNARNLTESQIRALAAYLSSE